MAAVDTMMRVTTMVMSTVEKASQGANNTSGIQGEREREREGFGRKNFKV